MISQTLTLKGWLATVARGDCGHIVCAGRDRCAYLPPQRPTLRLVDEETG